MATFLFQVQEKNRLTQKGLLKRFSLNCIGHQETVEEMRAEKAEKFLELKDKRDSLEYEEWFLRYRPLDKKIDKEDDKEHDKNKNNSKGIKTKKMKPKMKKTKSKKSKGIFF